MSTPLSVLATTARIPHGAQPRAPIAAVAGTLALWAAVHGQSASRKEFPPEHGAALGALFHLPHHCGVLIGNAPMDPSSGPCAVPARCLRDDR